MKIYDSFDNDERVVSFEIDNIGRARVLRFIEVTFPSAVVSRRHGDEFGAVDINGKTFIVNEPWGDNSRFTIYQSPLEPSAELDALRDAFSKYRPSTLFSGDRSFALIIVFSVVVFTIIVLIVAWLR